MYACANRMRDGGDLCILSEYIYSDDDMNTLPSTVHVSLKVSGALPLPREVVLWQWWQFSGMIWRGNGGNGGNR